MVNSWMNSDGLYIKYGTTEAVQRVAGEFRNQGAFRVTEAVLTLASAGTAAAIVDDNAFFPKNARIDKVELINVTAATGSGAVLNIGLQRYDRTTELDYDGLVAAVPLASIDGAGETTILTAGSTYVGALVGTTTSNPGYLTYDYDTAAFTAGVLRVLVYWHGV